MRVIIFNPYGIGDVLSTYPLLSALKQESGVREIYFLANSRAGQVLKGNPFVDQIIVFERDNLKGRPKAWFSLFWQVRKLRPDVAFDLTMNRNLSFFLMLTGAKERIGFDFRSRGTFLTKKRKINGFEKPIVEEYFSLYRLFYPNSNFDLTSAYPKIHLDEEEERFGKLLMYNLNLNQDAVLIAVFPGGGASWGKERKKKLWPGSRFNELIERLLDYDKRVIIMVMGDASDREVLTLPTPLIRSRRVFDLRGRLTLRESLSVLSLCSLSITNDGGPAHLSAAMGVNLISIMGPVPEAVYRPFAPEDRVKVIVSDRSCRPCYRNFRMPECPYDYACLKDISVEEVFSQCIQYSPA